MLYILGKEQTITECICLREGFSIWGGNNVVKITCCQNRTLFSFPSVFMSVLLQMCYEFFNCIKATSFLRHLWVKIFAMWLYEFGGSRGVEHVIIDWKKSKLMWEMESQTIDKYIKYSYVLSYIYCCWPLNVHMPHVTFSAFSHKQVF